MIPARGPQTKFIQFMKSILESDSLPESRLLAAEYSGDKQSWNVWLRYLSLGTLTPSNPGLQATGN